MKIVYEDKDILVIDKPAGQVVEPGAGKENDSLISEVLKKYPEMKDLDWPLEDALDQPPKAAESVHHTKTKRIGIVHRLDKDTSGLLVIAKNPQTQKFLMKQWQSREVEKEYTALVFGRVEAKKGRIELPIGRAPVARQKMAVLSCGREAITEFEVVDILEVQPQKHTKVRPQQHLNLSLLKVKILTGRTHQIRVHFLKIGHPVIGDFTYSTKTSKKLSKELGLNRQFLHASKLSFVHPASKKKLTFKSSLPKDLQNILSKLLKVQT
jgi:23S rRNA pseudouridine1911/1915/1917 synthase